MSHDPGLQMRVFVPSELFDIPTLSRVIENTLTGVSKDVEVDLRTTMLTWEEKGDVVVDKEDFYRRIWVRSKVWNMLDLGTKRHPIVARNAPYLVFQWGGKGSYKAKSTPGHLGSKSGGPSGPTVAFKAVDHPGTKKMGWTETAQKKWDEQLPDIMQRAIDAEAQRQMAIK